jgi:hypothetical protein
MTPHSPTPDPDDQVEIDAGELSGIFAVPVPTGLCFALKAEAVPGG